MMKMMLALGAAAVAMSAVPAGAKTYTNASRCTKYRAGHCVTWKRMTVKQARRAGYNVGYRFGPSYSYTDYSSLPQPVVTRYHLNNNFRYVNRDGSIYVVNPQTYRVVRVLNAM